METKEKSKFQAIKDYFKADDNLKEFDVVEKKEESKEVKEKFEEVTLVDGKIINVEPAVEPNAIATVMVEDVMVVVPAGEHELEDGRIIIIEGEEGIVLEVKDSNGEKEETPIEEELGKDATKEAERQVKKVIESITKESVFATVEDFNELVKKFDAVVKKNEFLDKELDEQKILFAELKEVTGQAVELFGKEPTKPPIKKNRNVFAKSEKTINGVKVNI